MDFGSTLILWVTDSIIIAGDDDKRKHSDDTTVSLAKNQNMDQRQYQLVNNESYLKEPEHRSK